MDCFGQPMAIAFLTILGVPEPWGFRLGAAETVVVTTGTSDVLRVGQALFSGVCTLSATGCYHFLFPSQEQQTQLSPVYLPPFCFCKTSFLFPLILPFHWWPQPFILEEAKFVSPYLTQSFEMATAVPSYWTWQRSWDSCCRPSAEWILVYAFQRRTGYYLVS